MLHLQRYPAGVGRNDGLPFVECFGYFDFESFASGELKDNVRGGKECIEELVVRCEAHDRNGG